jgi:hypothetical protein
VAVYWADHGLSVGFVIYSWSLRNWVFVATNVLMLGTALFGQWGCRHNKQRQRMARYGKV